MKHKFLTASVAAIIGVSGTFPALTTTTAHAAYKNIELENQKKDVQNKQSHVNSTIKNKSKKIAELEAETKRIKKEIRRLDEAVAHTSSQIREKEEQIAKTKQSIEELKKEISEIKARIEKRDELLRDRARSLQESGGVVDYLDVLLGSQDFGDFLNRISAVSTIVQADKEILIAHQKDKELKEAKENELNSKLESLEEKKSDLEGLKHKLDNQIKEKNKVISTLAEEQEHIEEEKHDLENEAEILAAQEAAIQESINVWTQEQIRLEKERKRKLEEERIRKARADAERARQEEAGARKQKASAAVKKPVVKQQPVAKQPVVAHTQKAAPPASAPKVTGGQFMRPANGYMSSGFGPRPGENHKGIDIANGAANVPIVAAADGVVFQSRYSESYGNVVYITHHINGQVFTTVYAHMESRNVSSGQRISKGTQIGVMGNTGWSTGKHLHFELHKGPWNASKSNAVNPASYINF